MPKTLKHSIILLIAGCCYGLCVPAVRFIYSLGYTAAEVMVFQYTVATLVLAVVVLLFFRRKVSLNAALKLCGVGVVDEAISFFFYHALNLIPSATILRHSAAREARAQNPAAVGMLEDEKSAHLIIIDQKFFSIDP